MLTTRASLSALAAQVFELVVFALGLLITLWGWQWLPAAWSRYTERSWIFVMVLAVVYGALGAVRFRWSRRVAAVAVAAFIMPLWIVGWIDWRIQYFLMFEHADAWQNLPRVIFAPANVGIAALLCACAALGHRLASLQATSASANAV